MKKLMLLTLAGVLTMGSFAYGKDRKKGSKSRNTEKTEKCCQESCLKTSCCKM